MIVAVALVTAVFCLSLGFDKDTGKVYAVTYPGTEYSQRDENNIILSVEKVGVVSTGEDYKNESAGENETDSNVFVEEFTSTSGTVKQMPTASTSGDPNHIYYTDIVNGGNSKYVVNNGSFVMLNNTTYTRNGYTYYQNTSMTATQGGTSVNMAEAIMVTFGTYYLDEDNNLHIAGSGNNENSGIAQVNLTITRNGVDISNEFAIRNYNEGLLEDISFIIPQRSDYDGYYTIDVQYFYNGYEYNQQFSFYLLFASTYNGTIAYNSNIYSINPSLQCADASMTIVGGEYQYLLGETSEQYPVLTYDYTKYNMSYTYTINGRVSTYVFYTTRSGANANLFCDITSSGVTTTKSYGTLNNFSSSRANNLISIVLTEMGSYTFSFDYIYSGYNSANAPSMNLVVSSISLNIHGFELKYSKAGHSEAQMRYLVLSRGSTDAVDVIVPNGYNYESTIPTDDTLGLAYLLVENNAKVGTLLSGTDRLTTNNSSINSNVNGLIIDRVSSLGDSLSNGELSQENIFDIATALTDTDYAKTNQGSLWLSTSDGYVARTYNTLTGAISEMGSFYYYSPTRPISFAGENDSNILETAESGTISTTCQNLYTNQTSFNATGYYLVFIKVNLNDTLNSSGLNDYYQVFAFKYVSETKQVSLTLDESGTTLGDNGYTREAVTVSWEKEGVFERTVSANYYTVKNEFYSTSELLDTSPYTLISGTTLGEDLLEGEGASFLVEIISEGEGRSYHRFTIDKQAITGVNMYEVEMNTSVTSSTITYGFSYRNGEYITIDSAITNDLASLFWDDKPSGARITATYTRTPLVVDNSISPAQIRETASDVWFSTNYRLGTTVGPFTFTRADTLGANVNYSSIIQQSGIYIFTLTDEAGNSCKYLFVYDATENYFRVSLGEEEAQMLTRESLIFDGDVTIEIGTHKVIALYNNTQAGLNEDLVEILDLASRGASSTTYANAGYFVQSGNNINAINSLFSSLSNGSGGSDMYLVVKNESLYTYDSNGLIADSSISNITKDNRTIILTNKEGVSSSLYSVYAVGINQRETDARVSRSFMSIEINTDKSRGMAFFSNDSFTLSSTDDLEQNTNIARLYYEGKIDENDPNNDEMIGTHATKDNYLAFTWYLGSGDFEVSSIVYDFYELDMSGTNFSSNYYYYNLSQSNIYLYRNGATENGAVLNEDSTRGFALLNVVNGQSRAGLYVVTRTYVASETADYGNDRAVQRYYFIVDRNGIINADLTNNPINGSMISVGLKEDETTFNTFSGFNMNQLSFIDNENNGERVYYYNYLTTDKMPAVLNIPIGKYFLNGHGSNYDAGRLTFTVYFVDRENQVDGQPHIIFEIDPMASSNTTNYIYENGVPTYYRIDISAYLADADQTLLSKLVNAGNDSSWLCLPGDYVVVINDRVESTSATNSRIFGFRITHSLPSVDIYSVNERDDTINEAVNVMTSTTLITSSNIVKIELPVYDEDSTSAGIDLDYIVVSRTIDGGDAQYYINYPYTHNTQYGLNINDDTLNSFYVTNTRDDYGNIVSRTLYLDHTEFDPSVDISYTITIRYDLGNDRLNNAYESAYYYYEANNVTPTRYFERTYYVIVDRTPPDANIIELEESDNFVDYFNEERDVDSLFESATLNVASGTYYVNRYNSYYNNGRQISDLFAFRVFASTPFNTEDVAYVYYSSPYASLSDVTMSLPYYSGYTQYQVSNSTSTYGSFLISSYNDAYVVIIEMDMAGNSTQYIVHYFENETTADTALNIELPVSSMNASGIIDPNSTITINTSGTGGETFTIFDIYNPEVDMFEDNDATDVFYRFELARNNSSESPRVIMTDASTSFSNAGLGAQLISMINSAGAGNYILTIHTHTHTYRAYINYYDEDEIVNLNIEDLIVYRDGLPYAINLSGANRTDENGIVYYASSITITSSSDATYVCDPGNNYVYHLQNTDSVYDTILLSQGTTYRITMTDAFGRTQIRNVSTSGQDFFSISFEGDSERNYYVDNYGSGVAYYTYNTTTVRYDNTLYTASLSLTINGYPINVGTDRDILYNNQVVASFYRDTGIIYIYPYWGAENGGAILQATVNIVATDNSEQVNYVVFIDTTSEPVTVRDINNNSQTIRPSVNVDYAESEITNSFIGSMTLVIRPISRDYFTYEYILHRDLDNGVTDDIDMDGITRQVLSESGTYRLEMRVYTADDYYLGNKVYTFAIHIISGQLYYVEGIAGANSTFTFAEIINSNTLPNMTAASIASGLGISESELNLYLNYEQELYISNGDLIVSASSDQGARIAYCEYNFNNGYVFTIYRVYTTTYPQFLATLETPDEEDLGGNIIRDLTLTKTTTEEGQTVESNLTIGVGESNIFYGETGDKFTLSFNQILADASANIITRKNGILLEIWYNGQYVTTQELKNDGQTMTYEIRGDGYYSFHFHDLAGNTHTFVGTNLVSEEIEVAILRELVLSMNIDGQPTQVINYGYFNGDVVLSAYNSIIYNGTLTLVSSTLNGVSYTPTRVLNEYTFSGYGTFRASFMARYVDAEGVEHTLTKTVVFNIINAGEAHTSIDLTNLANYQITKVTNQRGDDITTAFNSVINKANGMLFTYEQVIANRQQFNVSSGKQSFNITYLVSDSIYPDREVTFSVTLNNEDPYIECSLGAGESTNDSFTISYNAGIIYTQIGEAYLYVNDTLIQTIDADSISGIVTNTFSFDNNGAGDYYIRLVNTSGVVITSFKVTIEEPLNVWAIIIIVVVSVVVITVVTIIIVLRHKMRIR